MDLTKPSKFDSTEDAVEASEASRPVRQFGWKGIDGWLILPGIGLILRPILSVIVIAIMLTRRLEYLHLFQTLLVVKIGLLIYSFYAAWRFFGKRRNTPTVMVILILFGLCSQLLASILRHDFRIMPLVGGVFACCIWIPYFLVSRRVKETFVIP